MRSARVRQNMRAREQELERNGRQIELEESQISPACRCAMSSSMNFVLSLSVLNPMRLTQRTDTKSSTLSASVSEANIACVTMSSSGMALELGLGCGSSPV